MKNHTFVVALLLSVLCGSQGLTLSAAELEKSQYSPYANQDFPSKLLWGDTHLHTKLSVDAYGYGDTLMPEVAYAFAKGKVVESVSGKKIRLKKPLDFIVVSDHAEFLGAGIQLDAGEFELTDSTAKGMSKNELFKACHKDLMSQLITAMTGIPQWKEGEKRFCKFAEIDIWKDITAMADRQNEPGVFTAFTGFEWTSTPGAKTFHRIVIFKDDAEKTNQVQPLSAQESMDPEYLWQYMEDYEQKTHGSILAISHNGNLSEGLAFADKTYTGKTIDNAYAKTRARWEPLVEVTQMKGDSETHPILSPGDLFADYETWDKGNFEQVTGKAMTEEEYWQIKQKKIPFEYVREALKRGLKFEEELDANPYKLGMIGSTDSHISLSAVEENNFFGKMPTDEPSPDRSNFHGLFEVKKYAASGYAAVWAEENTRESIFAAMKRRETYATTGPRMMVRFFGGWQFDSQDHLRPDYAAIGYRKGVPMGSDLTASSNTEAPSFMVVASKDPDGANLERIQIVKGWLGSDGETREKVYDVVLSDNRVSDPAVMAPPIESTVDVSTASYTNSVGDPYLSTVWQDPEFNADERAFYYVRVLEIPTPRWTTYDAAFYGTELPKGVPAIHQERAYSSPIWYQK